MVCNINIFPNFQEFPQRMNEMKFPSVWSHVIKGIVAQKKYIIAHRIANSISYFKMMY